MKKITFCVAAALCSVGMITPFTALAADPAGAAVVAPAQQITVRGTVVDANGEAVPGASVIQKGTTNGVNTDIDGRFVLKVDAGSTLVISFVGYTTQSLKAAPSMKVVLTEDTELLEDVVVVGYGTMRKSDLTGSTSSLKSEALTATVAASPLEALQGKSTGVAVFTDNMPGAAPTLRIRGSASINASTDPLYVVDGFPLVDGDLNDINPADIESMEILKDASATAIYGSRGANGVVMITTKKGAEGRKNINVHASTAVQMRSRLLETVTGQEFIEYITAAYARQGNGNPFPSGYNGKFYNWQEETIESTALTQDYGITLDGATADTKYMFSAGYYDQEGLLKSQEFEKFTIHSNLEHKFNKWFTIGSSMQLTTSTQDKLSDNVTNDIFRYGWPTDPVYKEDGSYNIVNHGEVFNPIASMNANTNNRKNIRFLGNFFAQVNFTEHFNYRLSIGYDVKTSNTYKFQTSQTPKGISANSTDCSGGQDWNRSRSKLMDNIFTYSNKWGDHRMSLTGVYSWQDYRFNSTSVSASFTNDQLGAWNMNGAKPGTLKSSSDIYSNRLISWTARGTYSYADKYLLTATVRFDGSSRFGADNKWGTFPSVGLGWRVTNEEFLKDNDVLTDLKLRASYGVTGNQEIGNYQSLAKLTTTTGDSNYSNGQSSLVGYYESVGNPKLKWERTKQLDLGADISLYNRVNINIDYYNRNTDDLLYSVPIPSTSGFPSILSNVGSVENTGLEFAVSADIVRTKNWKVTLGGNLTYNKNEITKLYDGADRVTVHDGTGTTGLARILEVGNPVNGVYSYHSLGIIKSQADLDAYIEKMPKLNGIVAIGSEMYEDVNGDGNLSVADAQCIGSIEPRYFYGLNLAVEYKQLKLAVYGQGAWDYASMCGAEDYYTNGSKWAVAYQNTGSYALWVDNNVRNQAGLPTVDAYHEMWSESNPNGCRPAAGAKAVYLSDRTNADWNYFILKNIQLSYDFSKLLKQTNYIKGLSLNVNLQNFATKANHIGYNPENGDVSNPYSKSIIFGLNAKF